MHRVAQCLAKLWNWSNEFWVQVVTLIAGCQNWVCRCTAYILDAPWSCQGKTLEKGMLVQQGQAEARKQYPKPCGTAWATVESSSTGQWKYERSPASSSKLLQRNMCCGRWWDTKLTTLLELWKAKSIPCNFPPTKACPPSNQSSGFNNKTSISTQERTQPEISGEGLTADKWKGTNKGMSSPAITPSDNISIRG
jgi:hypothetical protein